MSITTIRAMMKIPLCCLAVAALFTIRCSAVVVDIPAAKDNTLYESATGSVANGAGDWFFAGRTSQPSGAIRRGLIEFDIAAFVPAGAVISSAALTLKASKGGNGSTVIALHRLSREWTEGASDAPGNEGIGGSVLGNDATWLHATSNTVFWTGPGAAGDFNSAPSSSQTITSVEAPYTWSGLAADVQLWLGDSNSNHGWILLGDEISASSSVRFDSRTNPLTNTPPVLRVDYTPVPEPAAAVPGGIALVLFRRRRRR